MGDLNQVKWIWVSQDDIQVRTVRTYKADDASYANNMEALGEENRFRVPNGTELWTPENGSVIYINNNGLSPLPDPCATTNIFERELAKSGLQVLPNPTRNKAFKIAYKGVSSIGTVQILTSSMQLVKSVYVGANSAELSLPNMPSGIYFAKAKLQNGELLIKKFLLD